MEFNMQPVDSSNIAAIGYNEANQVLRVEFNNGSIYDYPGVSPNLFQSFLSSDSKGRFHNMMIKSQYDFVRVTT